ncbi:MAG: class II aldolase/adducin family protein [Bacteroidota bacterium]
MIDEGYIKFKADWKKTNPLPFNKIAALNKWRQEMYRHQLIGAYENGIGFGNISQRWSLGSHFVISGSATGNFPELNEMHYSLVTGFDLNKNTLSCEGPLVASSESMSHAVIYQECPTVTGVIHVHHLALWKKLLHQIPTTDKSATYGSPEMANSIIDLLDTTNLKEQKIFVMEGHQEGVFAFGENLEEAATVILKYLSKI